MATENHSNDMPVCWTETATSSNMEESYDSNLVISKHAKAEAELADCMQISVKEHLESVPPQKSASEKSKQAADSTEHSSDEAACGVVRVNIAPPNIEFAERPKERRTAFGNMIKNWQLRQGPLDSCFSKNSNNTFDPSRTRSPSPNSLQETNHFSDRRSRTPGVTRDSKKQSAELPWARRKSTSSGTARRPSLGNSSGSVKNLISRKASNLSIPRDPRIGGGTVESKAMLLKQILSDAAGIKALQNVLSAHEAIRVALAVANNGGDIGCALSTSKDQAGNVHDPKERLNLLMTRDSNQVCADCLCTKPTWASTNLGIFLCLQCAGVHRSLGTHISTVASCTLDEWEQDSINTMEMLGNELANEVWEYHVPEDWHKPRENEDRKYRAEYIEAKYVKKLFVQKPRRPPNILQSSHTPCNSLDSQHAAMVVFVGLITVQLICGENFKLPSQKNKKLNVYCTLRLGKQEIRSQKRKGPSPTWNETLRLCWDGKSDFEVVVYGEDHHLGSGVYDLAHLFTASALPMESSRTSIENLANGAGEACEQEEGYRLSIPSSIASTPVETDDETSDCNQIEGRTVCRPVERVKHNKKFDRSNAADRFEMDDNSDSGEIWLLLGEPQTELSSREEDDKNPQATPKPSFARHQLASRLFPEGTPVQLDKKRFHKSTRKSKEKRYLKLCIQFCTFET